MAVCFNQGQELTRGDLDMFLSNASGNPTNAYSVTYSLYCVDATTCAEILIGTANRTPVNPSIGEYYAALQIPPNATAGTYRIRWDIQETAGSAVQQVVQEFCVVSTTATSTSTLSDCEQELVDKIRFMLRDKCVGGEELVELDVDGERMLVRMDDLFDALGEMSLPPPGN